MTNLWCKRSPWFLVHRSPHIWKQMELSILTNLHSILGRYEHAGDAHQLKLLTADTGNLFLQVPSNWLHHKPQSLRQGSPVQDCHGGEEGLLQHVELKVDANLGQVLIEYYLSLITLRLKLLPSSRPEQRASWVESPVRQLKSGMF